MFTMHWPSRIVDNAATAYLLQRMNTLDGELVSCRRIVPVLFCRIVLRHFRWWLFRLSPNFEWTSDTHLRHSKFIGLREDKDARKVVRE
jgi:hypothetical protein